LEGRAANAGLKPGGSPEGLTPQGAESGGVSEEPCGPKSFSWYILEMAHESSRGTLMRYEVQLGNRGRLVLPAKVRQELGLHPKDRLVLTVEESGELRLVSLRHQVERCMGMFKGIGPPGKLVSEELIAERRREARREERG
jgi:AbrB family looped-hinge helix DNA binding protein